MGERANLLPVPLPGLERRERTRCSDTMLHNRIYHAYQQGILRPSTSKKLSWVSFFSFYESCPIGAKSLRGQKEKKRITDKMGIFRLTESLTETWKQCDCFWFVSWLHEESWNFFLHFLWRQRDVEARLKQEIASLDHGPLGKKAKFPKSVEEALPVLTLHCGWVTFRYPAAWGSTRRSPANRVISYRDQCSTGSVGIG